MDNFFAQYNVHELKGSSFQDRTIDFGTYDISGATFEMEFTSQYGLTKVVSVPLISGSLVTIPFSVLEDKQGIWVGNLWMTKNGATDLVVRFNVNISDRALDPTTMNATFAGDDFVIEMSESYTYQYIDFESLSAEQVLALKGDKGDAFTYSDFTPAQIEALKVKGDQGDSLAVIQATDQAEAISLSLANPNNIYFWV